MKEQLIQLLKDPEIRKIIKEIFLEESEQSPAGAARKFFDDCSTQGQMFQATVKAYTNKGFNQQVIEKELISFWKYWTELSLNGKKQRWQKQPVFDIRRRITTWMSKLSKDNRTEHQKRTDEEGIQLLMMMHNINRTEATNRYFKLS